MSRCDSNRMNRRRWNIERIRKRHLGYRYALVLMVLLLLVQPFAQHAPMFNCGLVNLLAAYLMLFMVRLSPLRSSRIPVYGLGSMAILLDFVYVITVLQRHDPSVALALGHMAAWLLFFGVTLMRLLKALIREPYVTTSVVMGSALGYLLIGYSGGIVMNVLMDIRPDSFSPLKEVSGAGDGLMVRLPQMILGSFDYLTSAGSTSVLPANLMGQLACTLITIAGQLYIAIMIGLVLGRFHKRMG